MEKPLAYGDKIIRMEGVITEVHDGAVAIDLKGRLGSLRIPLRMFISEYEIRVGQEVAWNMSFIEQLGPEVNRRYLQNQGEYALRKERMRQKTEHMKEEL